MAKEFNKGTQKLQGTQGNSAVATKAAADPGAPLVYIGPTPPVIISNLPCGCRVFADNLSRGQQEYLMATAPHTVAWYQIEIVE